MSTNKYITSDGAGPMDSQSYVQSDWECASGHSKLQHNGESTLSVGSCWPYPAGREAVPRVAPPLGGRLEVQHRAIQSESLDTMRVGSDRVIRERGGGMAAFMLRFPALRHRPDLVLEDVDGPGTCVLVDVKLLDAAGPTWIRTRHTDRSRRRPPRPPATVAARVLPRLPSW